MSAPDLRPRIYLVMPFLDKVEPESMAAANRATAGRLVVTGKQSRGSALCRGINAPWAEMCNSQPGFDYFVILHSDVDPQGHWLDTLVGEMESHGFDAIHAFSPIKDQYGLTSTAYGSISDPWKPVRRITTTEIKQLPATFGIAELEKTLGRFGFDSDDLCMLCNTATLVVKVDRRDFSAMPGPFATHRWTGKEDKTWPRCFPGFTVLDRMIIDETGFVHAESVSEDWWFGRWASLNGLKIGCTSLVPVTHYGRHGFSSDHAWGMHKRDEAFFMRTIINHQLRNQNRSLPSKEAPCRTYSPSSAIP